MYWCGMIEWMHSGGLGGLASIVKIVVFSGSDAAMGGANANYPG